MRRALPEIICNTSPLQYLHQLRLLETVAALVGELIVPPAVVSEISAGRKRGVDLPDLNRLDWVKVRVPLSSTVTSLVTDLGPGEAQVLMLALESADAIVVLDDGMARQFAETLKLRLTGTLGLLIDAKHAGMLSTVTLQLDRLQALGFRLAPATRTAVLRLAGE